MTFIYVRDWPGPALATPLDMLNSDITGSSVDPWAIMSSKTLQVLSLPRYVGTLYLSSTAHAKR